MTAPGSEAVLQAELREMLDRQQLRQLVEDYAAAADGVDKTGWADLFTADGIFEATVAGQDAPMYEFAGRDQLLGVLDALEQYTMTQHFICNHRVAIDGDQASGEVYCTANHLRDVEGTVENLVMYIKYIDRYARTSAGWRFTRRHLVLRWLAQLPVGGAMAADPSVATRTGEPLWSGLAARADSHA